MNFKKLVKAVSAYSDQGTAEIAEKAISKEEEVVRLLALRELRGTPRTTIADIADQVGYHERTIYRICEKAAAYPPEVAIDQPEIVQKYLIKINPELRSSLRKLKLKRMREEFGFA